MFHFIGSRKMSRRRRIGQRSRIGKRRRIGQRSLKNENSQIVQTSHMAQMGQRSWTSYAESQRECNAVALMWKHNLSWQSPDGFSIVFHHIAYQTKSKPFSSIAFQIKKKSILLLSLTTRWQPSIIKRQTKKNRTRLKNNSPNSYAEVRSLLCWWHYVIILFSETPPQHSVYATRMANA